MSPVILYSIIGSLFMILTGLIAFIGAGVFKRLDTMNGGLSGALIKIAVIEATIANHTLENTVRYDAIKDKQAEILALVRTIRP